MSKEESRGKEAAIRESKINILINIFLYVVLVYFYNTYGKECFVRRMIMIFGGYNT